MLFFALCLRKVEIENVINGKNNKGIFLLALKNLVQKI